MFTVVFYNVKDGFTGCDLNFTVFVVKLGNDHLADLVEVLEFLCIQLKRWL